MVAAICAVICLAHYRHGYCQFGLQSIARHLFKRLCDLLAGAFTVQHKAGQLLKRLQRTADRFNQFVPVKLAYQAQAVDDVADGQVGRDLCALSIRDQRLPVGAMQSDPVG